MSEEANPLGKILETTFSALDKAVEGFEAKLHPQEVGQVVYIGKGVARVSGLFGTRSEEVLIFPGGLTGMAFNLDTTEIGVLLLGDYDHLCSGGEVHRTEEVLQVPVGEGLLGRVIDPFGLPLDDLAPLRFSERRPAERPAPAIMDRLAVSVPLMSGLKVVDALIPIGRGQRELILGDRQTGKTALAVDTIINQRGQGIPCVYCAIGQRSASIAQVVDQLKTHGAMAYTTVVVAEGDDPPGLQFIAPYAATTMAEFFMDQGRDVLVVYDDLTQHARAYREISLLLRRPPGREAFPGDIFYLHSRLLERSTHLRKELGGGSLTALPIIETESQNMAAYIPTNLISITDGQIYLSPELYHKGLLPAVDVGKSVSRVGGKTQLPAYRAVAGDLKLSYAQFEELEMFARFGTRLDEKTRQVLHRGRRVRSLLSQAQFSPQSAAEQVVVLYALNQGLFDEIDDEDLKSAEMAVRTAVARMPDMCRKIKDSEELVPEDFQTLLRVAREGIETLPQRT